MDEGFVRRLANLCKDHYVIRQIDDLFIYAGADRRWSSETNEQTYGSQRVQRFYEWVDGIKQQAPDQLNDILEKVALEISRNDAVPKRDRDIITDALIALEQAEMAEQGIQLEPLLSTLARVLANDGLNREVAILISAKPRLEWVNHDRFADADEYFDSGRWSNGSARNVCIVSQNALHSQITTSHFRRISIV
jgi:hypothetical protein